MLTGEYPIKVPIKDGKKDYRAFFRLLKTETPDLKEYKNISKAAKDLVKRLLKK